jgi:hypothetical protein
MIEALWVLLLVALAVPSVVVVGLLTMIVVGYWRSRKP